MNERQQLILDVICMRIDWLEALHPAWQNDARAKIDAYGFSRFQEIASVHDRGCRLKFTNFYGRLSVKPCMLHGTRMENGEQERASLTNGKVSNLLPSWNTTAHRIRLSSDSTGGIVRVTIGL